MLSVSNHHSKNAGWFVVLSLLAISLFVNKTVSQESLAATQLSEGRMSGGDRSSTTESLSPLVLIFPGILGEQVWDRNIKLGIDNSGFGGDAIIYDWTRGPLRMVTNIGGSPYHTNRIVQDLKRFKSNYPDRSVYLLGHSGGCRIVLDVLEAVPHDQLVERAILMSPCMRSNYNLVRALKGSAKGVVSFGCPLDFPISVPITAICGMSAGRIDVSATTVGFQIPAQASIADRELYRDKLNQQKFNVEMLATGNWGGHFGWTMPRFVKETVVPFLTKSP